MKSKAMRSIAMQGIPKQSKLQQCQAMQSKAMQGNPIKATQSNADSCRQRDTKQGTALRGKAKKTTNCKAKQGYMWHLCLPSPKNPRQRLSKKRISLIGVTLGSFIYIYLYFFPWQSLYYILHVGKAISKPRTLGLLTLGMPFKS